MKGKGFKHCENVSMSSLIACQIPVLTRSHCSHGLLDCMQSLQGQALALSSLGQSAPRTGAQLPSPCGIFLKVTMFTTVFSCFLEIAQGHPPGRANVLLSVEVSAPGLFLAGLGYLLGGHMDVL